MQRSNLIKFGARARFALTKSRKTASARSSPKAGITLPSIPIAHAAPPPNYESRFRTLCFLAAVPSSV